MTIVKIKMVRTRQSSKGMYFKGREYFLPFNVAKTYTNSGDAELLTPVPQIPELNPEKVEMVEPAPPARDEEKVDLGAEKSQEKPKAKSNRKPKADNETDKDSK